MRLAAFSLFASLLVAGAAAGYTNPAYPTPFNTSKNVMGTAAVVNGMLKGFTALPGKLASGGFEVRSPGNATAKVEVRAPSTRPPPRPQQKAPVRPCTARGRLPMRPQPLGLPVAPACCAYAMKGRRSGARLLCGPAPGLHSPPHHLAPAPAHPTPRPHPPPQS